VTDATTPAAATDTPAIEIQDLEFAWPGKPPILDIPALSIARGERVFLRGPSGSGKSTLLGLVGGVLVPQRGAVRLLGTDLATLGPGERDRLRGEQVGFVFQMFNLIPYLGLLENVLLPAQFSPARAARVPGGDLEAEGRRLLSIGQQQRVAAARALFGRPPVLVADEPTSALDHDTREGFLELLMDECRAQGSTLLFVSHDTSLGPLFDRVLSLAELNRVAAPAAAAA
jgi:putative ABC transport system ATP-binding protein